MKGGVSIQNVAIYSVISTVFIILIIIGVIGNATAKDQLYDTMADPVVHGAKELTVKSAETYLTFLKEVKNILVFDKLKTGCSEWYKSCTYGISNAPISPWTKFSEEGLSAAFQYLGPDCITPGINDLKKDWSKSDPSNFGGYDDFEQYNLIKSACISTLIDEKSG